MQFFCRDRKGAPIIFSIEYQPEIYVSYKEEAKFQMLLANIKNKKINIEHQKVEFKSFSYFSNENSFFSRLLFKDKSDFDRAMFTHIKRAIGKEIENTYTSKISQEIHFLVNNNWKSNGWIKIRDYEVLNYFSETNTTQLRV